MKRMPDPNPQVERILSQTMDPIIRGNIHNYERLQRGIAESDRNIENMNKYIAEKRKFKNEIIESMKYAESGAKAELKYMLTQHNKETQSGIIEKLNTEYMTDTMHDYYVSVLGEFNN